MGGKVCQKTTTALTDNSVEVTVPVLVGGNYQVIFDIILYMYDNPFTAYHCLNCKRVFSKSSANCKMVYRVITEKIVFGQSGQFYATLSTILVT